MLLKKVMYVWYRNTRKKEKNLNPSRLGKNIFSFCTGATSVRGLACIGAYFDPMACSSGMPIKASIVIFEVFRFLLAVASLLLSADAAAKYLLYSSLLIRPSL